MNFSQNIAHDASHTYLQEFSFLARVPLSRIWNTEFFWHIKNLKFEFIRYFVLIFFFNNKKMHRSASWVFRNWCSRTVHLLIIFATFYLLSNHFKNCNVKSYTTLTFKLVCLMYLIFINYLVLNSKPYT